MAIDPIALTRQLVDIESTTFHEGLAGAFLHEYLSAQRYAVERMPVPQPDSHLTPGAGGSEDERFNVYAALPGITPDVVLSTHMDTVPPFFGSMEDDEFIYGRGACDAKGIIAAQIAAADRLRDAGVKVGMLFVVGEERDSAGAMIANQSPRGSRFLINGEPTDNRLAIASKGALRVELRAKGRMAHSAYPELGESAIDKLIAALNDLLALPLPIEPEIGPSTLNIGLISGGRAPNVIADKAEGSHPHPPRRPIGRCQKDRPRYRGRPRRHRLFAGLALRPHAQRSATCPPWSPSSPPISPPSPTGANPSCSVPAPSTSPTRPTKRSQRRNCSKLSIFTTIWQSHS